LAAAFSIATADAKVVNVSLHGLGIGIDSDTGSIVTLDSSWGGAILVAQPESAGLLDLAYPVESFAAMRLSSRFSKVQITQPSADEVVIQWDRLGASRPNLRLPSGYVRATVTIRAASDGRSVVLTCHVENKSEASIPQELFPDLWGFRPFAGMDATRLRLARGVVHPFVGPLKPLDSAPPYYDGLGWKIYPAGGYYTDNSLRWLDFGGFGGGLSFFQKKWGSDDWPDVLTQRTEHDPMSLRLAFEHKQEIAPGRTWDSGEFWLTPHPGGWAKGIEVYRDYVRQVRPPRALPPQVRDGIGFQTIWMIQTVEVDPAKAAFRFGDLPRVAEDAHRCGLDELVPWGWCTYSSLPITVRPELGTADDLLAGVRAARELGVNVAPFISIAIVRNRYAEQYAAKPGSSDWTYHYELIPMFRPYYTKFWDGAAVDTNNSIWEHDVLAALTAWINRDLTSFCWDVFDAKAKENGGRPGLLSTIDRMRELAREKYTASTFSAESVTHLEYDSEVLDYTWNWVDYEDAAPITNVLRSPRLNCNVEDSTSVVRRCFADNLYLNVMPRKLDAPNGTALVSEKPELATALTQVAAIRHEFLPYFTEGTFIGDSVLSQPVSGFVRGYQMPDKLLIVVFNDQNAAKVLGVQSDLSLWLPPAPEYEVRRYDSSGNMIGTDHQQGSHWFGTTDRLEPEQFAYFEIQPH